GVQKADAIIAALLPFLNQLTAQNQPAVNPPPAANPPAATAIPNVPQPTVKLTEALATLKAALKEYNDDQAKQKELQEALKAALKKIEEEINATVPGQPAPPTPPVPPQ
ncbi:MAG: hypothetical protein AABP62_11955, partial [Planctomycetota bacterium]